MTERNNGTHSDTGWGCGATSLAWYDGIRHQALNECLGNFSQIFFLSAAKTKYIVNMYAFWKGYHSGFLKTTCYLVPGIVVL